MAVAGFRRRSLVGRLLYVSLLLGPPVPGGDGGGGGGVSSNKEAGAAFPGHRSAPQVSTPSLFSILFENI